MFEFDVPRPKLRNLLRVQKVRDVSYMYAITCTLYACGYYAQIPLYEYTLYGLQVPKLMAPKEKKTQRGNGGQRIHRERAKNSREADQRAGYELEHFNEWLSTIER